MMLDLTAAAVADLRSICDYTVETWGKEQESRYLDALWTRLEEILADPERWRRRDDLFPGCKIAAQEKHVILFRLEGDVLQVVRILHSAMDFRRHIPDEL